MSDLYVEVEARITEAIDSISDEENVTLTALAKDFEVPYQRLQSRFNGVPSRLGALAKEARNAAATAQATTATQQHQQT